jgi:radical SAM superfamily enzyme YgiQ (UPF0313 family)
MNKKVLIVSIPLQDVTRPPGILGILAGCCESIDVDYSILDLNLYMYKQFKNEIVEQLVSDFSSNIFRSTETEKYYEEVCEHLIQQIKLYHPTHIAISVFTYVSILAADKLLKYIKQSNLDIDFKIIIGGQGVTNSDRSITGLKNFGNYCLDNQLIDYCIYGEGDISFVKLLQGDTSYSGINQQNQKQLLDLDSIPMPSYKQINPQEYFFSNEPEILITGSRGCVRDCTFCNVGHYWGKYVYKSGDTIANELFNLWKTTGVQKFDFSDSLINGSIKTFRQMNQTLIKLKSENPTFKPTYKGQFICRPSNQLKEQDYADMVQAGAETLVTGIESFSNAVRDHMKKKFDNDSIDWHFKMCAKYGIKNVLLLLAGYVTETEKDHQIQLEYLKKYQIYALSRTIYAINIDIGGLKVLDGTPLIDMVDELGIVFHTEDRQTSWRSLSNPSLTIKERLRRSMELVHASYQLGYKVLHFNSKVTHAEDLCNNLLSIKEQPVFNIELA